MVGPFSYDGAFRRGWLTWRRNAPGPWLHPVSFWQYADISGTDPSHWRILKVRRL
jgi:primary-amine oxidase